MITVPDTADRARALLDLHTAPGILALANVWDVASARAVAGAPGVRALATASHAIAATFGYEDGENIPLELHLDMVARITAAVDLPVSMDLEAGYGDPGATARQAIAAGVVGGNLEDRNAPVDDAVAAVEAVLAAGRAAGVDFVLNARTDAFVLAAPGADRSIPRWPRPWTTPDGASSSTRTPWRRSSAHAARTSGTSTPPQTGSAARCAATRSPTS